MLCANIKFTSSVENHKQTNKILNITVEKVSVTSFITIILFPLLKSNRWNKSRPYFWKKFNNCAAIATIDTQSLLFFCWNFTRYSKKEKKKPTSNNKVFHSDYMCVFKFIFKKNFLSQSTLKPNWLLDLIISLITLHWSFDCRKKNSSTKYTSTFHDVKCGWENEKKDRNRCEKEREYKKKNKKNDSKKYHADVFKQKKFWATDINQSVRHKNGESSMKYVFIFVLSCMVL